MVLTGYKTEVSSHMHLIYQCSKLPCNVRKLSCKACFHFQTFVFNLYGSMDDQIIIAFHANTTLPSFTYRFQVLQ